MLTNKITGFSADLLNTVRGILGEAKKCPADCECEKCEAEEDDMEEGYMPTADEPTDANKKTADKVRAMLAKEKKPVKEEIDADLEAELKATRQTTKSIRGHSRGAMGRAVMKKERNLAQARMDRAARGEMKKEEAKEDLPFEGPYRKTGDRKDEYGNKVKNVAKHLAKKAMKANEEAEHTNCGTPECCGQCDTAEQIDEATAKIVAHLQKRYGDNIRKSHVRSAASDFGVDASKLAKAVRTKLGKTSLAEDEQIDEVSKATLGRYINKAKDSIDTASYRQGHKEAHGSSSKPLEKKLTKRHKGISTAVSKLTKEDAEQIDEISSDMAHRYLKGKHERDYDTSADGKSSKTKKPQSFSKMNKDMISTARALRTIEKAKKTNEDVEQIDELSKGTMGRYINKAATKMGSQGVTAGLKIAADEKSSKNFKDMGKREKGIKLAVNKLTKEEQDFVDSLNNEIFEKADPYDIAGMIKKAKAKNDPNHPAMKHVAAIEDIKKHGGALSVQGDHVRSLIKALGEDANVDQIDELSKDAMLKYLSANKKDDTKARETGDYDKMTKRMRGTDMAVRKYTAKPGSKYVRVPATEEVELDEISKGTAMKALQHVSSDPDDVRGYTLQKKIGKKWPEMKGHAADASYTAGYGRSGRNIFQDRDKLADRAKTSYRMTKDGKANKQDLKARFRKEEVELDEARGRPRKAGAKDFTIHPKTKEKLMHNNPADMKRIERLQKNGVLEKPKVEAGQHIMNQLQKAKTSMLGGSKINFTHGDSKEVSGPHAAKILTKYAGMKPNEKEDFQKFVGHSHENLMKHV